MALQTMSIADLLTKVRYTLQDISGERWTDPEMFLYLDDGLRDIAVKTMYNRKIEPITLVVGTDSYTLDNLMIKLHDIDTVQDYTITDGSTLTFVDTAAEEITVTYYAYPDRIVYGVDILLTLEEDMYDMLRHFILSRCYEKEDSTELLAKSDYFMGKYREGISQNNTRWHGVMDVTLAKNDYLT